MKSRREAVTYADKLMKYEKKFSGPIIKKKSGKMHFGKVELKMLMDFVYGEPRGEYEELMCIGDPPYGEPEETLGDTGILDKF